MFGRYAQGQSSGADRLVLPHKKQAARASRRNDGFVATLAGAAGSLRAIVKKAPRPAIRSRFDDPTEFLAATARRQADTCEYRGSSKG
jgi:hypothetical protein